MDALREILEEKLKDHHNNLGTLGCQEALAERKKVCVELGLLRKEDQHLVKSLSEALPVPSSSQREEMEEVLEQEKPRAPNYLLHDNEEQYGTQSPCTFSYVTGSDDDSENDEATFFMTPVPSNAMSDRTITTEASKFKRSSSSQRVTKKRFPSDKINIILESTVSYSSYNNNKMLLVMYIPLISRVFGPYCKLRTEFFPSIYGPSAKRAGHKSMEKKRGSVIYSTDRKNEANKMFIIWRLPVWGTGNKTRDRFDSHLTAVKK